MAPDLKQPPTTTPPGGPPNSMNIFLWLIIDVGHCEKHELNYDM